MYFKSAIIALLSILILEGTAHAQTILSGYYGDDVTLTRENSPYLVVDSAVFDGSELFIERGVIITFKYHPDPEKKSHIRIKAPLYLETWDGAPPPAIVFTSERDNTPFDLNGDSTASRPAPGDWGYICFDPKWMDEYDIELDSLIIRYGGGKMYNNEPDPGLYPMTVITDYNNSDAHYNRIYFRECIFEHSAGVGVLTGMAAFRDCKVNHHQYGIRMLTSDALIWNSEFSYNKLYPIYLIDPVIKRDGGDYSGSVSGSVFEAIEGNEFYNNGVDAIALEGSISCAYDLEETTGTFMMSWQYPYPILITNDLVIDSIDFLVLGSLVKFLPASITGKPVNITTKNSGTFSVMSSVFTSLFDPQHSHVAPKNTDPKPVPGDWGIISTPQSLLFQSRFEYGGKYFSDSQQQVIPDSSVLIQITGPPKRPFDMTGFENGGIAVCTFAHLFGHGIGIDLDKMDPPFPIDTCSFILAQNRYGIITNGQAQAGEVNAQNNYWNGKLGPFHPQLNSLGNGCLVGDYVDFSGFETISEDSLLMSASVLRGQVRNSEGTPVKNAMVRLNSKNPRSALTDRDGMFYLPRIKPGMGYELEFIAKAHHDSLITPLDVPADTSLLFNMVLQEYEIDYAIDNFAFDINPEESEVSVGGTAHRYYRVVDIDTKEPVFGVEVLVPYLDTFYTNSSGIVDIAIPSDLIGNTGASRSFYIRRVGIETLDFPEDDREEFTVSVLPYQYNKIWSGNTYFKVGIFGFEATKERGAALDLYVKDEGFGEYADSIRMVRQSRTGFGLDFGAAAKIEAGPASAGAEASVGVNLEALFEDDFKFDYPNTSGRLALAKFIVLADGALPYMDAPLVRYFVSCLERQVSEIEAAARTNGIGMNLHAQASAEAGLDLNLLEGDQGSIGAELSGNASAMGDITFMSRLYAHKNPITDQYPLDLDFNFTGEVELGVNASLGFDLSKLFGSSEESNIGDNANEADFEMESDLPFPMPDDDFGFDLASVNAAGGVKFGLHFGTTRFLPGPTCRMGFMYGYQYNLSASVLGMGDGISENREIIYTFDFQDETMVDMISQTTDMAKSMISPENLIKLDLTELSSGQVFNDPLNNIAYQQTRNSFLITPVPYQKTISDKVDEGGFNIGINIGIAIVKAKFGAGFNYAEVNNYQKEAGVFYNWELYPLESYDYLPDNESFMAGPILQDIVSTSASYLVEEIKNKLIPPIFRKIRIWPFNKKATDDVILIGPASRTSYMEFVDAAGAVDIEGIDSLNVIYWDWYGTGEESGSTKSTLSPGRLKICEYVRASATHIHKLDYGIGGFYQFEPYNTSVGDHEVYVVINYFDDELEVMLSDSSLHMVDESKLRMYRENKEINHWEFIGGVVDTLNNTVKARIDAFGTFTLAPFIPSGSLELIASPDTISLDFLPLASISSSPIMYNTGVPVSDGELFTIKASRGTIDGDDADESMEGFQVAASMGKIEAIYATTNFSGSVKILAESVRGDARGSVELFVTDSEAPDAPVLSGIEMAEEEVHLWWQRNSEPDMISYLLHYDTISGGPYRGVASVFGEDSPVNAGLDSTLNVSGLMTGKTWYFALTAVDRCGNMSSYSNELSINTLVNHRPVFYHQVIHIEPDLPKGTVIDTLQARDEDEGQTLTFYLTENNSEDAFAVDPLSGELSVHNENRLDYFHTRTDTLLLQVGVRDDAINPSADEGLVMVILDVETWVPKYPDKRTSALELYPNPASDYVTVKLGESGWSDKIRLAIYATDGSCRYSAQYNMLNRFEQDLPLQMLEQGVYHVVLETEKEKRIGKLVIVK